MSRGPVDHHTNTVEDAAAFEQWRGTAYDDDPRPTKAEIEADDARAEAGWDW